MVVNKMVRFFYPRKKGDYIKGAVVDYYIKDKYGNELIVLNTNINGENSDLWALPAHSSLKYQCEDVVEYDILEITYNGKKLTENNREMHDYEVKHIERNSPVWYAITGITPDWD